MKIIPESFLQFLWKYRLFNEDNLVSDLGKVEIIEPGCQNDGSGPDFFNARIRINGTVWAGNVEVHTRASDWFRHGHQDDPAYSNVILHVVQIKDCQLERPGGELIPAVVPGIDMKLFERYDELVKNKGFLPCHRDLENIPRVFISEWISRLMIEKLEEKTSVVQNLLIENKYNWEETLYRMLGRGFGFQINNFPFETLARTSPLLVILKYRQRPLTINALLFGQAGFLEDLISGDEYYMSLQREYRSIRSSLPPRILGQHTWKFRGGRPANFPLVRIAQFASLVTHKYPLFSRLLDNFNLKAWRDILEPGTEKYWENHYLFGKTVKTRKINMGRETIDLLILNVLIPVFFHYATFRKRPDMKDRLLEILEQIPAEENVIIKKWSKSGIIVHNAFESQALIHLNRKYCLKRKCLECVIGQKIIREN